MALRPPPYDPEAHQYPKMVYLGEAKAGKGILVQNKDEHDALLAKQEKEAAPKPGLTKLEGDDEKAAATAIAEGLGIAVDKRWGIERIKSEIAEKQKADK